MGTLILPDWNYPLNRRPMTDAERWTAEHDFTRGTEFVNRAGQKLAELLDAEATANESGTVYPRRTFPGGSAVVLGQSSWHVMPRAAMPGRSSS
jgi:hypothetical protein